MNPRLQDVSACTENMLLAANALGLGSCWIGIHPRTERIKPLQYYFKLPDNIIPVAGIALGYPAQNPEKRNRYNKKYILNSE